MEVLGLLMSPLPCFQENPVLAVWKNTGFLTELGILRYGDRGPAMYLQSRAGDGVGFLLEQRLNYAVLITSGK